MKKAAKTKKTAAHRKAEQEIAKLETGLRWLSNVNVDLHAQISAQKYAIEDMRAAHGREVAAMRRTFDHTTACMCVDHAALEGSIKELKRQLAELIIRQAK